VKYNIYRFEPVFDMLNVIHSAHIGLLEYMDTTKYEVQEISKAAFEKHLLANVYPNLFSLVPLLFHAGVDLQAVRLVPQYAQYSQAP
jgi:hypothetical protein